MLTAEEQTLARRDPASVTNKELTAEVSGWLVRGCKKWRVQVGGWRGTGRASTWLP